MGWVEMLGWLAQMNRQRTAPEPSVDTWDEAAVASMDELRARAKAGHGFARTG
jgi:hypothetical protein